ncbi:Fc.00g001950.m01.CDS01 [Cosmosporella sp. VM-42]
MSVGIPPPTSNFLPSPVYSFGSRRALLPPPSTSLPKLPPLTQKLALLGSGLRTPPVDEMSTAFQPSLASYDNHAIHSYGSSMAHAHRTKAIANDTRNSQYYRYPTQQQHYQQQHQGQPQQQPLLASNPQQRSGSFSSTHVASTTRNTTQPSTPGSETVVGASSEGTLSRRGSESLVFHSLQIPKCISPTGGNLADFAAQMTCLFWFESIDELKQVLSIGTRSPNTPIPRLPALAKPDAQFRKWVYTVLSTTQVTQNVILLALLFIYRLKMSTPQIKGRAGSEYRLLTVALMLGNKFLDDNTYTNKTWAEVSCFAVQEIHVMEVEFLSNMRYNLVATKDQWEEWLDKLACFHEYYERALRLPASPIHIPSPPNKAYHSPIPSPTGTMQPGLANLPVTPTHTQNWNSYQANAISPLAMKPTINFPPMARKRSPEDDLADHPAKRAAPNRAPQGVAPLMKARINGPVEASRLPVPHLTLATDQAQNVPAAYAVSNGFSQAPQQVIPGPQGPISLPPLQPGVRAMATVYQPTPVSIVQQPPLPATTATSMAPVGYSTHAPMNFGTPSKHHSPGSLAPYNSSPLAENYASQAVGIHTPMAHTPISNSPSVYLQQRPSPYKPVRHVNTLLYPPPSASLDQYHLSVPLPPTQMHYQPLGRRNDLRTGIVPEFLLYNRGMQHQASQPQAPQGHYQS